MLRKDVKFQQASPNLACYQISPGKKPKDLEDFYKTYFKSICNWVHRLNDYRIEGLIDKEKSGRNTKLRAD